MMKNKITENNMKLEFAAISQNESLARVSVAAFLTEIDPTLEEINDIKTAVSEAVTNAIIHGYSEGPGIVTLRCNLVNKTYGQSDNTYVSDSCIKIVVEDQGVGIENIQKANEEIVSDVLD